MATRRRHATIAVGCVLVIGSVGAAGCGSPSPGASASPSAPAGSRPAIGTSAFCRDLSAAAQEQDRLDVTSVVAGTPGAATSAVGVLHSEQRAFAGLAAEAPASVRQPVADVTANLGALATDVAAVGDGATDPDAPQQQALAELAPIEDVVAEDETAVGRWVATHCPATP